MHKQKKQRTQNIRGKYLEDNSRNTIFNLVIMQKMQIVTISPFLL